MPRVRATAVLIAHSLIPLSFAFAGISPTCGLGHSNIVPNCAFDTNNDGWWASAGAQHDWDPTDGSASGVGSDRVMPTSGRIARVSRAVGGLITLSISLCFDDASLAGATGVTYGADFREASGNAENCRINLNTFLEAACSGGATFHPVSPAIDPGAESYLQSGPGAPVAIPTGTSSYGVVLICDCALGLDCSFNVDDVFLGVGQTPVELLDFILE